MLEKQKGKGALKEHAYEAMQSSNGVDCHSNWSIVRQWRMVMDLV